MAGRAKEEMEIAGELEKVQLAVTSAMTQSYGSITEEAINSTFQEEFGKQPIKSEDRYVYESDSIKYVIKEDGKIATAKKGYDSAKTMEYSSIGTTVRGLTYNDGTEKINENGFQIFNIDDNNIYLISKNRITAPNNRGDWEIPDILDKNGKYKDGSLIFIGDLGLIKSISEKWLNKYVTLVKKMESGYINTYCSTKMTAYMLDTTYWQAKYIKANNKNYEQIEYVIGGPTIEMLCDAYNKKNSKMITAEVTRFIWI